MTNRDRLARIIRVKERIRDAKAGAMQQAEHALRDAEAMMERADAQLYRVAASYTTPGEMTARELAHRAQLVTLARERREAARASRDTAEEVRGERAAMLGEAQREVRSLEAIDERLLNDERRAGARREQAASDEHAARRGPS